MELIFPHLLDIPLADIPAYLSNTDNCSCASDYNCEAIFANYTNTQKYISKQSKGSVYFNRKSYIVYYIIYLLYLLVALGCTFIRELLADGRNETVDTFLGLYSDLTLNGITLVQKDTFLTSIMDLLVRKNLLVLYLIIIKQLPISVNHLCFPFFLFLYWIWN